MNQLYTKDTQAIFWNNNKTAIQRMLDYDYTIKRETPSVAAIVAPTSNNKFDKFFFGPDEVMIPLFKTTAEAKAAQPQADVLLNFASFRTAYDVTMEALEIGGFSSMMITAEGIPERLARGMNQTAREKNVVIIGPATVGAITPGAFKVANIGGTITNIVNSKLHRAGSCGLVTRSGGLFNELSNIISINADGIAEGVAIGGDRFVGSVFIDNMLRMEKNPAVKYMILLGEVGGTEEYKVIKAIEEGKITKPVIAWCIGTIAKYYDSGVQFGHAGASANAESETADYKNNAMRKAGIHVPTSFNELPGMIKEVFEGMNLAEIPEPDMNTVPAVRRSKEFICTISDDRGEECTYAGFPISSVATPATGKGIGDVIALLWFKKQYPKWATEFIETVIKTVADHGPAVSGAHNAKVTARSSIPAISAIVSAYTTEAPPPATIVQILASGLSSVNFNEAPVLASASSIASTSGDFASIPNAVGYSTSPHSSSIMKPAVSSSLATISSSSILLPCITNGFISRYAKFNSLYALKKPIQNSANCALSFSATSAGTFALIFSAISSSVAVIGNATSVTFASQFSSIAIPPSADI